MSYAAQVVDCDKTDGGCQGGDMRNVFDWVKENGGLCTLSDYPYQSGDSQERGTCEKCQVRTAPFPRCPPPSQPQEPHRGSCLGASTGGVGHGSQLVEGGQGRLGPRAGLGHRPAARLGGGRRQQGLDVRPQQSSSSAAAASAAYPAFAVVTINITSIGLCAWGGS
jgi:hypothetical protein